MEDDKKTISTGIEIEIENLHELQGSLERATHHLDCFINAMGEINTFEFKQKAPPTVISDADLEGLHDIACETIISSHQSVERIEDGTIAKP